LTRPPEELVGDRERNASFNRFRKKKNPPMESCFRNGKGGRALPWKKGKKERGGRDPKVPGKIHVSLLGKKGR